LRNVLNSSTGRGAGCLVVRRIETTPGIFAWTRSSLQKGANTWPGNNGRSTTALDPILLLILRAIGRKKISYPFLCKWRATLSSDRRVVYVTNQLLSFLTASTSAPVRFASIASPSSLGEIFSTFSELRAQNPLLAWEDTGRDSLVCELLSLSFLI
jgi:hypothetical protein